MHSILAKRIGNFVAVHASKECRQVVRIRSVLTKIDPLRRSTRCLRFIDLPECRS